MEISTAQVSHLLEGLRRFCLFESKSCVGQEVSSFLWNAELLLNLKVSTEGRVAEGL